VRRGEVAVTARGGEGGSFTITVRVGQKETRLITFTSPVYAGDAAPAGGGP
jgi:hypothetical protein